LPGAGITSCLLPRGRRRKSALRWTMLMTALREAGLPRSALSRIAILAADNPSFSQLAMLCNSASV
jgi:hypothetical protein